MSTLEESRKRLATALSPGRLVFPRTERERERRRIVVLAVPFLVLAVFGAVVPLWEMLKISVSESQFATEGFTLAAYETLVTDPVYPRVAWNTLWFAAVTTVASVALGVVIAHGLENYDLPREDLLVTLISFPISLPGIVAAFMMIVWFGQTGLLTGFVAFLSGADPARTAVATSVIGLFFGYLYSMIPRAVFLLRGTYAEVNSDAEEAARALGATPWQTFRYVTFPQIRPGVVGALILVFRTALAIFGTVLVLKSLSVATFRLKQEISVGYHIQTASAMAAVFFVFTLAFTFIGLRLTSAEVSA